MKKNVVIGKNSSVDKTAMLGTEAPRLKKGQKLIIGDGANIRSNAVIYTGTSIGKKLQTGHNVVIREENKIGNNFSVWNNTTIDYDCKIGNNVKIHCNCYIAQFTTIEDDVFMAPGVTIANDMHPGCSHSKDCMKGPTIKRGTQIGCNVTIVPFVTIGENCLIGSGTVITKDIPPNSVVYGNPGKVQKNVFDLKCVTGVTDKPYKKGR